MKIFPRLLEYYLPGCKTRSELFFSTCICSTWSAYSFKVKNLQISLLTLVDRYVINTSIKFFLNPKYTIQQVKFLEKNQHT